MDGLKSDVKAMLKAYTVQNSHEIRTIAQLTRLQGFLTSGNPALERLTVYLWSTAKSPPRLLRCNRDVARFVQEAQWPLHQAFNPYSSLGHPSSVVQYLPRTAPAPRMKPQTYVVTQNQRPVNATSGLVKTQSRGVFICRLGFDVNQQQLEVYLSRFGPLQNCEIKRDPMTGKSRGTATAKFLSAEIAATVVCSLDGQQLMGKRVEVRFDKDHEMVAAVNTVNDCLIIANGSQ